MFKNGKECRMPYTWQCSENKQAEENKDERKMHIVEIFVEGWYFSASGSEYMSTPVITSQKYKDAMAMFRTEAWGACIMLFIIQPSQLRKRKGCYFKRVWNQVIRHIWKKSEWSLAKQSHQDSSEIEKADCFKENLIGFQFKCIFKWVRML